PRVTPPSILPPPTPPAPPPPKDDWALQLQEFYTLVDVPEAKARKIVKALNHCTIRGRKAKVKLDQS
ncbi:MAG: DbpA RNA binding domain-containing protein, partial [Actinomycetota bacterium]